MYGKKKCRVKNQPFKNEKQFCKQGTVPHVHIIKSGSPAPSYLAELWGT
jgi:hypothetical protein